MTNLKAKFALFDISKADPSTWSLLTSNIITMLIAVRFNWNVLELLWLYWCQSVIIGDFNILRILRLRRADSANTASFFALHYGFFHLIYAFFLYSFTTEGGFLNKTTGIIQWQSVIGLSLVFLVNHAFSFFLNFQRDKVKQTPSRLMIFPYARIIPMHLTILLAGVLGKIFPALNARLPLDLLFFLLLKTVADLIMHNVEHA